MNSYEQIERHKPDPEGLDFKGLRDEGLFLLQELCGEVWTDYNFHDPGVTILEQLCYALTDLAYRADFPTADYLTGKDGLIDYEGLALYLPGEILPSQGITENDYRKILFDAIPEIDNVWLRMGRGKDLGLYKIYVRLKEELEGMGRACYEEVISKVRKVYGANRNLGEDLKEVAIVIPKPYTLHARVEVEGTRHPTNILAEIYFKCKKFLAPGITSQSPEEAINQGKTLGDILSGPITENGYIDDARLDKKRDFVTVSDLIRIIDNISGVKYVENLYFKDEKGERTGLIPFDPSLKYAPRILFPETDEDVGISLYKNQRKNKISLRGARVEFDRHNFEYINLRHSKQKTESIHTPPRGKHRNMYSYYSIQNHFPDMYGINENGVPVSAPEKRKAQAKQLKAYLLFFEQVMANYLVNLQKIPLLFSPNRKLKQSTFHQLLNNKNAPHVEELYKYPPSRINAAMSRMMKKYDRFEDRRSRLLDYLLALYGESFKQKSLRLFNYYFSDEELSGELIRNKITFLQNIPEISKNRAKGFNYMNASWNTDNISCLKKKASILLGFKYFENRSLTAIFIEEGLELISDSRLTKLKGGAVELEFVDLSDIDDRINRQFREVAPETPAKKDFRRLFNEIVLLRNNVLNESFLVEGIYTDRYRVGSVGDDKVYQVVFKPYKGARWCYLASYDTERKASIAVNDLRGFLIRLNENSEGMHMVEHILLRPLREKNQDLRMSDDFYNARISVIFPSWTARCKDKEFRKLAQETVRINCPAHIYPEFYWLDFTDMRKFEILYKEWLTEKSKETPDPDTLDEHSKNLASFLLSQRNELLRNASATAPRKEPGPAYTNLTTSELESILGAGYDGMM